MTDAELRELRRADPALDAILKVFDRHLRLHRRIEREQDALAQQIATDLLEADAAGDTDSVRVRLLRRLGEDLELAVSIRDGVELERDEAITA